MQPTARPSAGGPVRTPSMKLADLLRRFLFSIEVVRWGTSARVDGGGGLVAEVDENTNGVNISVDGSAWLLAAGSSATWFGVQPHANGTSSLDGGGLSLHWAGNDAVFKTDVLPGPRPGSLTFRQTFTSGIPDTAALWSPSPPPAPTDSCGPMLQGHDQTGGHECCGTPVDVEPNGFRGYTTEQCCAACIANATCNAFVVANASSPDEPTCWLIADAKTTRLRPGKAVSFIAGRGGGRGSTGSGAAGDQDAVLAGFPVFASGASDAQLNYLGWGGCQLSPGHGEDDVGTHIGRWTGGSPVASHNGFTPFVLFDSTGRSLVMSPGMNFFVGIHSTLTQSKSSPDRGRSEKLLQAGIKASVLSIPKGFVHETVLVAGDGLNNTLISFGDLLLAKSNKSRVDPYEDFVLSHLGHWNDAGAFYYHNPNPYQNYQQALLAVKADAEQREIPFRYSQWDDWWAFQHGGDFGIDGGVTNWWPMPSAIPAGMTDWLGLPLSLYSSSYSGDNVYLQTGQFKWTVDDEKHAIPTDRTFYDAIFANGSKVEMKMFEQDFLCSINGETNLTRQDVDTGMNWLHGMNEAAVEANVSLQLCMMNPIHTLASTLLSKVSNGRATRDNHAGKSRVSTGDGLVLGISGMLHYACGIWPSRDNVWTNASQARGKVHEPMVETQSLLAFLAGGPYGPSDGAGGGNRSLIVRSCRDDGLLLRADKPITMMDSAFTALPFENLPECHSPAGEYDLTCAAVNVWSTHSDIGHWRYGYVLGLDLKAEYTVTPADIVHSGSSPTVKYFVWEYWGGVRILEDGKIVGSVVQCDEKHPFRIPAPTLSPDSAVITSSYHIFAPVLASGWTFLGEPGKLVPASNKRVRSLSSEAGLEACLVGVESETISVAVVTPESKLIGAVCLVTSTGEVGLSCFGVNTCECKSTCAND